MVNQLDDIDAQIMFWMRENARITIKELADKIGTRRSTIYAHLNKLQDPIHGMIKGYTVIPNFKSIGNYMTVFILISVRHTDLMKDYKAVNKALSKIPQILEVHSVTGEFDHLLKVRGESLEKIGETVFVELKKISGVDRMYTLPVFYTQKEELSNQPIDFDSM